ncbi:hypothetical protein SDJN02_02725, partial [Cucurbita argyrosperma subsp. argyrosperma]
MDFKLICGTSKSKDGFSSFAPQNLNIQYHVHKAANFLDLSLVKGLKAWKTVGPISLDPIDDVLEDFSERIINCPHQQRRNFMERRPTSQIQTFAPNSESCNIRELVGQVIPFVMTLTSFMN